MNHLSRRDLLRGRRASRPEATMLPPWALAAPEFFAQCDQCAACLKVCETGVLTTGGLGYPEVNFDDDECTFCGACVDACKPMALVRYQTDGTERRAFNTYAIVTPSCLAIDGVTCQACRDACEPRAIQFHPMAGATAIPTISEIDCTGCGACINPCPVDAMTMSEGA